MEPETESADTKTGASQVSRSASTDWLGLGVRILPEQHRVELLFEADDWAEDADGNPAPAGLKIAMNIKPTAKLKTVAEYEEMAAKLEREGAPEMELIPGKFRRITWEQYRREGYDEEP